MVVVVEPRYSDGAGWWWNLVTVAVQDGGGRRDERSDRLQRRQRRGIRLHLQSKVLNLPVFDV